MNPLMDVLLSPEPEKVTEPTPGSIWVNESESLRFIKVAKIGRNATCIVIKKSDGALLSVELNSWIGEDCKPLVQA
jgi:hypothetical protein